MWTTVFWRSSLIPAGIPRPFTVMDADVRDRRIGRHRHIDAAYLARPTAGEAVLHHESSGYLWIPVGEVASLPVPEELPALITAAAAYAESLASRRPSVL